MLAAWAARCFSSPRDCSAGKSTPGLKAKLSADVLLGSRSAGISYLMALSIGNDVVVDAGSGLLGAQVLFRLWSSPHPLSGTNRRS